MRPASTFLVIQLSNSRESADVQILITAALLSSKPRLCTARLSVIIHHRKTSDNPDKKDVETRKKTQ